MKRMTSDEEVHNSTVQTAKKPRLNELMDAAEAFYHEIKEKLEAEESREFERVMLAFRRKEISDVVAVQNAMKILEGNPRLFLSFAEFVPEELKEMFEHPKELELKDAVKERPTCDQPPRLTDPMAIQEPNCIKPAAHEIPTGDVTVEYGSSSRSMETWGYCSVLDLWFPRRSRYSQHGVKPSNLDPTVLNHSNQTTESLSGPEDVVTHDNGSESSELP